LIDFPRMLRSLAALWAILLLGPARPADHPLKHRILWTWDTWICEYDATGRSYLQEYKDLIDWMAKNEYTALILWGFVDGRHGGEPAAKELARYARGKGIALLPGVSTDVGASADYGGFVLGLKDHPFSDEVQARAMAATKRPGEVNLCYSRAENREWLRKGTQWLLDTFEVDGINLEVAEGGLRCRCAECLERLKAQGGPTGGASFSDLSLQVPIVADVFREKRPAGLVTYATYNPMWWDQKPAANELLKGIPASAAAQWNLELSSAEKGPSPVKVNLALLHGGGESYHLRRLRPATWAFTQHRCFDPRIEQIRAFAANVRKMKFDGFVAGDVGSPKNPDCELAYHAFIDFTRDPDLTLDGFFRKRLGPLYGDSAVGEVTRLFAAQPGIHEKGLPFWRNFDGSWDPGLRPQAKEAAKSLADQLSLARAASGKASADGKRRLDQILPILEEYRIICEAAASGEYDGTETRAKLAEFYEKAGLPDDLYGFKRWK
jgi:hypothetical protein